MECEHLSGCPIFARFKVEGLKNIWINMYCRGPQCEECARKRLKKSGAEVSITLLPNGKHLDALGEQKQ